MTLTIAPRRAWVKPNPASERRADVGGPHYRRCMAQRTFSRAAAQRYRIRAQGLAEPLSSDPHASGSLAVAQVPALDLGVQDTGPDGSAWALRIRGVDLAAEPAALALAWTLRGAPHAYRRSDLPQVAQAVSPFSEADAAKRVFDAAKPLREAGVPVLTALATIAAEMRDIVREPIVKGAMSTELHARLGEEYQRYCRACQAVHLYEQPFRLAALFAGLELTPGTSPPILRRVQHWPLRKAGPHLSPHGPAQAPEHLQPIRAYLRLLGPATVKDVAAYIDAPLADVRANWPEDAEQVTIEGRGAWILSADLPALQAAARDGSGAPAVRLLAPFDPYLQAKDREIYVPNEAHRKDLFRTIGRPGGVLVHEEIVGSWRPRAKGKSLGVRLEEWGPLSARVRSALEGEGERLAAHRGLSFGGFVTD